MGMQEPQFTSNSHRLDKSDVAGVLPPPNRLPLYPVSSFPAGPISRSDNVFDARRMSAPELPPIASHRSLSSPSYANRGMRSPTIRVEQEKIFSRNTRSGPNSPAHSPENTPRSSLSLSGHFAASARSTSRSVGDLTRAKSWCATEHNNGPNPKLETLFEINNNSRKPIRVAKTDEKRHSTSTDSNRKTSPWRKSSGHLEIVGRNSPKAQADSPANRRGARKNSRTRHHSDGHGFKTLSETTKPTANDPSKGDVSLNLNRKNLEEVSKQNGYCTCEECDTDSSDVDKGRIIQWLIGIESSGETPPPPIEISEQPEKTDTAIHIIYEGD